MDWGDCAAIALIVVVFSFCTGLACYGAARDCERDRAFRAGVGRYAIDPATGDKVWVWLDLNKPPEVDR